MDYVVLQLDRDKDKNLGYYNAIPGMIEKTHNDLLQNSDGSNVEYIG